jgi:putative AdoMet-dependent methyltransferase
LLQKERRTINPSTKRVEGSDPRALWMTFFRSDEFMQIPDWQWNEMQQIGTDYADIHEVEKYDERMGAFRDVNTENREMLDMLQLPAGATVLEIGCGTGRFVRAASAAGLQATAIDVSSIMLAYVQDKAQREGLNAITTQQAGFLTLDFPAGSFDAVVSGAALHHLPDAWKMVALHHIARVLKPHGQFILRDVVFSVHEAETPEMIFERFADSFKGMRLEAARHVAQEFSTYDWIMEGLLKRAGFRILIEQEVAQSFVVYHCQKTS